LSNRFLKLHNLEGIANICGTNLAHVKSFSNDTTVEEFKHIK